MERVRLRKRYDPVLLTGKNTIERHFETFDYITNAASPQGLTKLNNAKLGGASTATSLSWNTSRPMQPMPRLSGGGRRLWSRLRPMLPTRSCRLIADSHRWHWFSYRSRQILADRRPLCTLCVFARAIKCRPPIHQKSFISVGTRIVLGRVNYSCEVRIWCNCIFRRGA